MHTRKRLHIFHRFDRVLRITVALSRVIILMFMMLATGCDQSSISGVYRDGDAPRSDRAASNFDFRSNGTFIFTAEGRTVNKSQGTWKKTGGGIICYNDDGSTFAELKWEGRDLISASTGKRYRKD